MRNEGKGFNGDAFYKALAGIVETRQTTWSQVASETGVGASTLTRMARGSKPDAASLAVLSAWAGLNPTDFVRTQHKAKRPAPMAQISKLLRDDPDLDEQAAETVEAIVKAAYDRLKKSRR